MLQRLIRWSWLAQTIQLSLWLKSMLYTVSLWYDKTARGFMDFIENSRILIRMICELFTIPRSTMHQLNIPAIIAAQCKYLIVRSNLQRHSSRLFYRYLADNITCWERVFAYLIICGWWYNKCPKRINWQIENYEWFNKCGGFLQLICPSYLVLDALSFAKSEQIWIVWFPTMLSTHFRMPRAQTYQQMS